MTFENDDNGPRGSFSALIEIVASSLMGRYRPARPWGASPLSPSGGWRFVQLDRVEDAARTRIPLVMRLP
ncbi:MAG: hypothetical protein KF795_10160 [Labilithrix sp.]|nr:hypothetical protein [Labilithrix sp.]